MNREAGRAPPPAAPMPLYRQLTALIEEIPHMIARQEFRAKNGDVHWGVAAPRIRELEAAKSTLKHLVEEVFPGTPSDTALERFKREAAAISQREVEALLAPKESP